jgi:hypothetical protein
MVNVSEQKVFEIEFESEMSRIQCIYGPSMLLYGHTGFLVTRPSNQTRSHANKRNDSLIKVNTVQNKFCSETMKYVRELQIDKVCRLLACGAAWVLLVLMFRRDMSPPSSR